MTSGPSLDGVLVRWGDRLFYPGNRVVRSTPPRLSGVLQRRAAVIRARIHATVVRRAPQVMVKVTGGGRGMAAIAAHLRYISKGGRLPLEDDRGVIREGREAVLAVAAQWRFAGSHIGETSHRREAFNIMLSMPSGTPPEFVLRAAREFAQAELADHRYVLVLHDHQANPHVHLSVRAESRHGMRLNPRKADLQRWRETFAEKLRGWGIEAEATRQATRGQMRNFDPLWRSKAAAAGRERTRRAGTKSGPRADRSRKDAIVAWAHLARGLAASEDDGDRALAGEIDRYVRSTPFGLAYGRRRERPVEQLPLFGPQGAAPPSGRDSVDQRGARSASDPQRGSR